MGIFNCSAFTPTPHPGGTRRAAEGEEGWQFIGRTRLVNSKYIAIFSTTVDRTTSNNKNYTISKTAASRDTSMCETGKLRLDLMEPEASFFCQAKI